MKKNYALYRPAPAKEVKDLLLLFSKSRTLSASLIQRARIILLAAEGRTNKEITQEVSLHVNQIGKWRNRFLEEQDRLNSIVKEHPEKLPEELTKVLKDAPRAGRPLTYNADNRTHIVTLACQDPCDHGFERSHWSLPTLKARAEQMGIVSSISCATINRILNENEIKPHKKQYWLHSTEKYEDPETYKEKVRAINKAYQEAANIRKTEGPENVHIISTDEMTGIQALEHKYPDKLPGPKMTAKQEFEYIRHGTTSLIAFLDVIHGKISSPYLNKTRNEEDFVEAFDGLIATDPDGTWIIVADNLNTHMSESLVRYVADKIDYKGSLGKKGKEGILKSKESRTEFLTDTSHRIRFLFTPKHCSWMNQIEIWFGIINRQLLRRKSYMSLEELEASIIRYIEQYNRLFAHPFNWKYNTTPLGD